MQLPSRMSPGAASAPLHRSFSTTSEKSSSESPRIAAISSQLDVGVPSDRQHEDSFVDYSQEFLGLSKRKADNLLKLCIGNGVYALPSLSSEVRVKPAEGDGLCFMYSALAATDQADSERAAQACLRRAGKHLQKFVRKDVDPVSWAEDKDGMQATVALKEQMMRDELEDGYLNQPGQELIAYSEQTCFLVLSTSTPTDELMEMGQTTFAELLAAMQHFSLTIIGSVDYGKTCLLVRHKHADPAQEGLYHWEHFMPIMPAKGVFHTFDTPTELVINHLVETRERNLNACWQPSGYANVQQTNHD
ncbi:MAG: hypothetical protein FRX49_04604 [Trebouxia sp. A1-2]|nr:MAG: hypothetical protein FRX49_04604 [Trebouxia sp. A1-2]